MIRLILPLHLIHGIFSLPYTFSTCEKYPGLPSTFEKSFRVVPPLLIASVKTTLIEQVSALKRFLEVFPASLFGEILARKRLSEAYILPTPTTTLLSIINDLMFLDFPLAELKSESLLNS